MNLHPNPSHLLQELIRFDTTNPPGSEAAIINFLLDLLSQAGIQTQIVAKDPRRPNLIARLPGDGRSPGLLLQGHVDVVTTAGQKWSHPPFAGLLQDGYIWGRGALDMKGGVAMMVTALLRLKAEGITPAGDITLCLLADEEAGGVYGARFLVEEHPQLFDGIKYALGEFGGFTLHLGGGTFYPIQVAEKLQCQLRLIIEGPAGHGSQPIRGGAMARLGQVLHDLDHKRTPVHITSVTRMMIERVAANTNAPTSLILRQMQQPRLADALLNRLGDRLKLLEPIFRNTISPTIVHGGDKINVIPCLITLDCDGRMLPGFTPDQMVAELQDIVGPDIQIEVLDYDPPISDTLDMALFSMLSKILRELDPQGTPIPYILPAVSDARFFARLGIQHYGFVPLKLPPDFNFNATIHAADERVPQEAIHFGAHALFLALQRYGH